MRMTYYAGKTYCPKCGELHFMRIVSRDEHCYPKVVSCCGCNEEWGPWPSRAEFAERKKQCMHESHRKWVAAHKDERRAYMRDYFRKRRAKERAKHEYEYEYATCQNCGKEFVKTVHNKVFCSRHCRYMKNERERMKRWAHERYEAIKAGTWKVAEE